MSHFPTKIELTNAAVAAIQANRAAEPVSSPTVRACAASVLHLWTAPAVVGDYLLTAHPDLLAEAAREAWAVVSSLRSSGPEAHAARAAARAIDGADASRVLSAAAAAMGAHAGQQVPGRGTASYDASRAAEAAFRAEWTRRLDMSERELAEQIAETMQDAMDEGVGIGELSRAVAAMLVSDGFVAIGGAA